MFKRSLLVCGLLCSLLVEAEVETLVSPNGLIAVTVADGSPCSWQVMRKGTEILKSSRLGLQFKGQPALQNMKIVARETNTIDQVWTNRLYKKEVILDEANELFVMLEEKSAAKRRLGVRFRAYDGAVAFRYEIPKQPKFELFTITKECTTWRFPGDPLAWVTVYAGGDNISYKTSQEEAFKHRSLRSISPNQLVGMPALIEIEDQWVALCEANLTDWSGMFFRVPRDEAQPADSTVIEAALAPIPECGNDLVIAKAPCASPWHVMMLADSELDLLAENDVILNLNPPAEGDFSWVKPGVTSWDWWTESNNSLSTELTLKMIDFAAEMGWSYHTIDAGWYGYARTPNHGPGIKIFPREGFDLDRILKHATEKNIGIWVWCHWTALEDNGVDAVFADFQARGIKGVKVDFMDRQDQSMVRWYEKVVRSAAKHHLMINFHGAFKPTGMNRTWPNQITREGIRGNEMNKFSGVITASHTATLPFTRFLVGPADYTPGGFGNVHSKGFIPQNQRGHRYGDESDKRPVWAEEIGTRAHAIALCVAYDSPLMTLCDWPERYHTGKGLDALRNLPTVWRNTLPLAGKIAHYYGVVRESYDGKLYVAIIGVKGATFELPTYFLPKNTEWDAAIYVDGPNATQDAKDLTVMHKTMNWDDKVTLTIAPEGGAVLIFTKK